MSNDPDLAADADELVEFLERTHGILRCQVGDVLVCTKAWRSWGSTADCYIPGRKYMIIEKSRDHLDGGPLSPCVRIKGEADSWWWSEEVEDWEWVLSQHFRKLRSGE